MSLEKIVSENWNTRRFFYRPDSLGYCVIISDMIRTDKYLKMTLEEKQKYKGRTTV